MRAAVADRYGAPDLVRIVGVPQPTPRADEVLVRVKAVAVTSADSRIRRARFPAGFAVSHEDAAGLLFGGTTALFSCGTRRRWAPGCRYWSTVRPARSA